MSKPSLVEIASDSIGVSQFFSITWMLIEDVHRRGGLSLVFVSSLEDIASGGALESILQLHYLAQKLSTAHWRRRLPRLLHFHLSFEMLELLCTLLQSSSTVILSLLSFDTKGKICVAKQWAMDT